MGKHNRYTKEQVLNAIERSGGIVSNIASKLGCNWHTAQAQVGKWKETKQAYEDEAAHIIDFAESQVIEAIKKGDIATAKWYLSKKAIKRGYGDTPENEGEQEEHEVVKINISDTEAVIEV